VARWGAIATRVDVGVDPMTRRLSWRCWVGFHVWRIRRGLAGPTVEECERCGTLRIRV
jgi:hypothetical protein